MAGGLMQLVAYGAQDVYLTGNPKITFFQAVYKRHTNFVLETSQQTIDGSATNGGSISTTIQRNGDLLGEVYVQLKPKAGLFKTSNNFVADCNWIAERAFLDVEWQIGGQRIDKHYQVWWRLYSELYMGIDQKRNYAKMTTFAGNYSESGIVQLPLLFSFCTNRGLYLPLVALQFHEVKIIFSVAGNYQDYFEGTPIVWAQYVLLDTEERSQFATKTHEYLIEQVQHNGGDVMTPGTSETSSSLVRVVFNHPVKEVIWCYQTPYSQINRNSLWNFSSNTANVQVTCNPQVIYNSGTLLEPSQLGIPMVVHGTNAGVFTNDGEHGTNFVNNGTMSEVTVASPTVATAGTASTITVPISVGALIQLNDVITVEGSASATNTITGIAPSTFYYVKGLSSTSTTTSITLGLTYGPQGQTLTGLSTNPAHQITIHIQRLVNCVPVAQLPYTSFGTQPSAVTLVSNVLTIPWNSVGVVFANNTSTSALVGNLYYFANSFALGTIMTNVPLSNTLNGLNGIDLRLPQATQSFVSNVLLVSQSLTNITQNLAVSDNRPITNVMIEEGIPGRNVEVGPLHKFKFLFNGRERFVEQYGKYFNYVQNYYHHDSTNYPGIYSYSFALKPDEFQPSGTCNFSRIDMAQAQHWLKTTSTPTSVYSAKMFAVNYNILKISSGMGGILFSN